MIIISFQVMIAPPVPAHESAWERGLRQAKEMRRRSSKRRETDVEYEEKKASLSLTQVGFKIKDRRRCWVRFPGLCNFISQILLSQLVLNPLNPLDHHRVK